MRDSDWVGRAAAEYAAGRHLALLFDYDGTLTPLVAHPSLAALPDSTRDLLAELAGLPRVTVGILSGRALRHVRELVGLPGVRYVGSGGMDMDLGGEEITDQSLKEFERIADSIAEALSGPVRWFGGAWVERKPGCLSVHYRELTPLKAACFCEEVRDTLAFLEDAAPPLRVRDVSRALEIGLAAGWTKAEAVDRILAGLDPRTFPVFAGDGANDEEAVARVNDLNGLTVGVGPDVPAGVQVRVATTEDFAADLDRLLTGIAGPTTRRARRPAGDPAPSLPIARGL
jgi:trehalose-phosphatase